MKLTIYVPSPGGRVSQYVAPGSGIVGVADEKRPDRVRIWYEGNLYDAENMRTYKDRLMHAADRAATNYPTVARATVPKDDLIAVGVYDTETWSATFDAWFSNVAGPGGAPPLQETVLQLLEIREAVAPSDEAYRDWLRWFAPLTEGLE